MAVEIKMVFYTVLRMNCNCVSCILDKSDGTLNSVHYHECPYLDCQTREWPLQCCSRYLLLEGKWSGQEILPEMAQRMPSDQNPSPDLSQETGDGLISRVGTSAI